MSNLNKIYSAEFNIKSNPTRRACLLVEIVWMLLKLKLTSLKVHNNNATINPEKDLGKDSTELKIVIDALKILKSESTLENIYDSEKVLIDAWISSKPEELKKEIKSIQSPHPYYQGATS